MTRPVEEGGLGIQTAKGRNLAYLAKLNWRFNSEKEVLWTQVLRKKYMSPRRINSRSVNALPSSRTWKAMKAGMDTFTKGTRWGLGRDSNLKFWYDSWASKGPLRGITNALLIRGEDVLNIRDVASANRWE